MVVPRAADLTTDDDFIRLTADQIVKQSDWGVDMNDDSGKQYKVAVHEKNDLIIEADNHHCTQVMVNNKKNKQI